MRIICSRNRIKGQSGFGLLEVIIASAIMGTAGVTLLLGLNAGILGADSVSDDRSATALARSQLEHIKTLDFSTSDSWDSLDAVGDWTVDIDGTISPDNVVYQEGSASLKIVKGSSVDPGAKRQNLGGLDWSAYTEVHLWAMADAADKIVFQIWSGSAFESFDAILLASDEWQWLRYDLTAPDRDGGGAMDWQNIDKVIIKAKTEETSYTFRIDDFRLYDPSYTKLPQEDIPDGWMQDQIEVSVTSLSPYLQLITVTVTYGANDDRSIVLESYKARY